MFARSAGIPARIERERASSPTVREGFNDVLYGRGHTCRIEHRPVNLITAIADHAFDAALSLVYPQPCATCAANVESRHDGIACANCWLAARLFTIHDTLCWKCGALSLAKVTESQRQRIRCGRCEMDAYTAARSCGLYEGALRAAILELKRQPHIARRVARFIYDVQQREPLNDAELIIPVPLHKDRERERGFNQAAIVARALSRLSGIVTDEYAVTRRVHTERHRAGMDAKARRQSVANAFMVRHPDSIAGKRVLLIDDVFTTGATVSECAAALKEAGAEKVFVLTVARASSL